MKTIVSVCFMFILSFNKKAIHFDNSLTENNSVEFFEKIALPCTVSLRQPENSAVLNQTYLSSGKVRSRWTFSWTGCPGATKYQLYIIHPALLNPFINNSAITATSYRYAVDSDGAFTLSDGWTWKVRAFISGRWSAWSETYKFNIKAVTFSVSGKVTGKLSDKYHSDTGDENYTIVMKKVFLVTADGKTRLQEATIRNGKYVFTAVPSGKSYRIYPDSRFKSNPEYILMENADAGVKYKNKDFYITGLKPEG